MTEEERNRQLADTIFTVIDTDFVNIFNFNTGNYSKSEDESVAKFVSEAITNLAESDEEFTVVVIPKRNIVI